jgi:hypothetical protein
MSILRALRGNWGLFSNGRWQRLKRSSTGLGGGVHQQRCPPHPLPHKSHVARGVASYAAESLRPRQTASPCRFPILGETPIPYARSLARLSRGLNETMLIYSNKSVLYGGGGGIRTHGTISVQRLSVPGMSTQIGTDGKVNSRWLQAPDLDLLSGFSRVLESCSV